MDENNDLPSHLLRHLADSELEVVSLNEECLSVRVNKEIGPEHGLLEFREPSFVCIPPKFGVTAISMGSVAELPTGFLSLVRPNDKQLDQGEKVYLIDGAWGERFFVIATAITYQVTN